MKSIFFKIAIIVLGGRPQCAVDNFVRWAADICDILMKPYFYPDLDKSVLLNIDEPFPDTYFNFPIKEI